MPLTPIIDKATSKKLKDSPKMGTVVANNDPEKLGRIKATVQGIFDGDEQSLPWIRRKNDTSFCGADSEMFDVPEIGSIVEVRWDYDENTPMYSGAPQSKRKTTNAFTGNYPYEAGFKFGDCLIKFDKKSKLLTIDNGQAQIVLDAFGDCSIACNSFHVKCDSDATISAPQIILDGNVDCSKGISSSNGASGIITPIQMASVSGGIVESVH